MMSSVRICKYSDLEMSKGEEMRRKELVGLLKKYSDNFRVVINGYEGDYDV